MNVPSIEPKSRQKVAVISNDGVLELDIREMLDAHDIESLKIAPTYADGDLSLYEECIAAIVDVSPQCSAALRLIDWLGKRNVSVAVLGSSEVVVSEEVLSGSVRFFEKPVIVEKLLPFILAGTSDGSYPA